MAIARRLTGRCLRVASGTPLTGVHADGSPCVRGGVLMPGMAVLVTWPSLACVGKSFDAGGTNVATGTSTCAGTHGGIGGKTSAAAAPVPYGASERATVAASGRRLGFLVS